VREGAELAFEIPCVISNLDTSRIAR